MTFFVAQLTSLLQGSMGKTKPGTVRFTGAPPGGVLIGSSPHNKGLLIHVEEEQARSGQRVLGPFRLLDAGEGPYASFLATVLRKRFESAGAFVAQIRENGAAKFTHAVNRNCLKLVSDDILQAGNTAGGPTPPGFRYEVALSFAGEERGIARRLAGLLRQRGLTVFYDEYEQAELWGKDLYQHLSKVYRDYSKYCVIIASDNYDRKQWTRLELRQAQARAIEEHRDYILPLRVDDTDIPGIPRTVGYIDIRNTTVKRVADLLDSKVRTSSVFTSDREGKDQSRAMSGFAVISRRDSTVSKLVDEVRSGSITLSYQCPDDLNPLTGKRMTRTGFFEDLRIASESQGIAVLEYDPEGQETPYCYISSYNLCRIAVGCSHFSDAAKRKMRRALKAYEQNDFEKCPWGNQFSDSGALLFAEACASVKSKLLVILRILLETESSGEPTECYGAEIPTLATSMSVAFDIWEGSEWRKISRLLDFHVDDLRSERELYRVKHAGS